MKKTLTALAVTAAFALSSTPAMADEVVRPPQPPTQFQDYPEYRSTCAGNEVRYVQEATGYTWDGTEWVPVDTRTEGAWRVYSPLSADQRQDLGCPEPPPCASKREMNQVKLFMTRHRVHRILDTSGERTFRSERRLSRAYRTCDPDSRFNVLYRRMDGRWKVWVIFTAQA